MITPSTTWTIEGGVVRQVGGPVPPGESRACEGCGDPFDVTRNENKFRKQRFCSIECFGYSQIKRRRA